jgi:hypothetical protein
MADLRSAFAGANIGWMKAIPAPSASSTSRHETADRVRRASSWLALALVVTGFPSVAQEPAKSAPEPANATQEPAGAEQELITAVWKSRQLSFTYSSATSIYSCSALRGRVSDILRAVGARDDMRVSVNDCREGMMPPDAHMDDRGGWQTSRPATDRYLNPSTDRQLVHVSIRVMMPTEVTPAVMEELKKDKSRRELLSHVTGDPAAKFNDPVAFPAQWQPVTLSHKTIGLEPEECELIDEMSPTVFRQLGLKVVRKNATCERTSDSHIPPELVVEALMAVPYGNSRAPRAPAEVEKDDADPAAPPASGEQPAAPAAQPAAPAAGKTPE